MYLSSVGAKWRAGHKAGETKALFKNQSGTEEPRRGPEEGAAKPASTRLGIAKDASQVFQEMEACPVDTTGI